MLNKFPQYPKNIAKYRTCIAALELDFYTVYFFQEL